MNGSQMDDPERVLLVLRYIHKFVTGLKEIIEEQLQLQ
jgi:hypothetical protein